jgi:hypothetical protein
VFVTFICNKTAVAGLQPFPRDIMSWTGQLYGKVFRGFGEFHLRENGMSVAEYFVTFLFNSTVLLIYVSIKELSVVLFML